MPLGRNDAEVRRYRAGWWRLCRRRLEVVLKMVEVVLNVLGGCAEGSGVCVDYGALELWSSGSVP